MILVFCMSTLLSKVVLKSIQAAWQRQLDFTADASHELRTPLAVMLTNLEVVLDNTEETVSSQIIWLENAMNETKRMAALVDDLLTLSRADTNEQMLNLETFNLAYMIEETLKPYYPIGEKQGIEIVFNNKLKNSLDFYGDQKRIQQLIVILIDNALKHMGCLGRITVEVEINRKQIELQVKDTGEGINKEDLKKIFNRFYRVDKANSRKRGGSGLGLAIAKWIVESHKGTIEVKSETGIGTAFKIKLPADFYKSNVMQ
ncbi:sensor histidine kinase [Clostridium sp. JS66]|uniref:sensor histidine kinase n=1 Tax=Clostridium sp. JS66 TaxID=3064705 RepID=UPI00298EC008|nr:ATP-binding protein [Clostridium sp. JS66]WPC43720.1 ATP-binding protein [Clostridium sp. JS66]